MSIEVPKSRNMRYVPALSNVYRPQVANLSLGSRDLVHFSGNKPAKEKKEGWLKRLWNFLTTPFRWFASLFKKKKAKTEDTKVELSQTSDKKTTTEMPPVQETSPVTLEKGQVESDSAVSAPGLLHAQAGTPMSFESLFGSDLTKVTLEQTNGNTCFILALLDNILNHPSGKQMLESAQVHEVDSGYDVQLAERTVHVTKDRLKQPGIVKSNVIGIPILEQAYLELLPAAERRDHGEASQALSKIFPSELQPDVSPFGWSSSDEHYKANLQQLIKTVKSDPKKLPLLTALRKDDAFAKDSGSEHFYSVRLLESNENEIVLRNPFVPGRNEVKAIDDFIQHFQLNGLGKAQEDNAVETIRNILLKSDNFGEALKRQVSVAEGFPESLKKVLEQDPALLERCRQEELDIYRLLFGEKE